MQLFPQSEDLLLINKRQLQQFSLIIIFMGKINSCLVYGRMLELANRIDLGSIVERLAGSNPAPPTNKKYLIFQKNYVIIYT